MPEVVIELARTLIDYVDEKYGRLVAWFAALASIGVLIAFMLAMIAYFLPGGYPHGPQSCSACRMSNSSRARSI